MLRPRRPDAIDQSDQLLTIVVHIEHRKESADGEHIVIFAKARHLGCRRSRDKEERLGQGFEKAFSQ